MCCDFFELTDAHGGESLRRLPVNAGDLVLVDRGYNDRTAVGQILDQGGDVVMRYHSRNFPLLTPDGQAFDPLKELRKLKIGEVLEWPVRFVANGKTREARLCAICKSTEQAERTLRKIKLKTKGKFERVKPATLEFAKYVVVVCTIPAGEMSARLALEFYRARWQAELAFKRLKSLLLLGQLPKRKEKSSQAWMQGKILTALLIERTLCEERFFPHGVTVCSEQRHWILFKEIADSITTQLGMPLRLDELWKLPRNHRAYREKRPKRPRQLQKLKAESRN